MSVHLLSPVWKLALPPTLKITLLSLADQANDDGLCWPSVRHLCARTCLKERAVFGALKRLEAAGLIHRDGRPGRSTLYRVTPAPSCTPARSAPPPLHVVHPEPSVEPKSMCDDKAVTQVVSQKAAKATVPFAAIVELYHRLLPTLPRCEKLTKTRAGYLRQRWLQDLPTLPAWQNYFADVAASDFLMGRAPPSRDRPPFRADLEWLTRPGNFAKVAEGKYHHD